MLPLHHTDILEQAKGVEPSPVPWQGTVLPLYYACIGLEFRQVFPQRRIRTSDVIRFRYIHHGRATHLPCPFGTRRGDRTPDFLLVGQALIPAELYGYMICGD